MKHIFIINPFAGKTDSTADIMQRLRAMDGEIDYVTHVTTGPSDATQFARHYCQTHHDEELRFYACGGDGTLNEVASALVDFAGTQLACYPCGSGNDYLKCYGSAADFADLQRQVHGQLRQVDLMRVNDRYSINVSNFGFDAEVCRYVASVKRKPVIGGPNAYTTGIVMALMSGLNGNCRVEVDGQPFHDGDMLLATVSNGQYVGGAYRCAPRSVSDDGLLEVCVVGKVTLLRFAGLIGKYRAGQHLDDPSCADLMHYCRARRVDIVAPKPLYLAADGEVMCNTSFSIENLQHAITFVLPAQK